VKTARDKTERLTNEGGQTMRSEIQERKAISKRGLHNPKIPPITLVPRERPRYKKKTRGEKTMTRKVLEWHCYNTSLDKNKHTITH